MNTFKFLIFLVIANSSIVHASSSEVGKQETSCNSRCSSPNSNLANQEKQFLTMFIESNKLLAKQLDDLKIYADKTRNESENCPFRESDNSLATAFYELTPHATQYEIGRNQAITASLQRIREVQRQSQEAKAREQENRLRQLDIIDKEHSTIR